VRLKIKINQTKGRRGERGSEQKLKIKITRIKVKISTTKGVKL
jgi:hypothetical protein